MAFDCELKLSSELQKLCEPHKNKWKEKKPEKSAIILYKLGLLYKDKCLNKNIDRLEQKIKFIQSVALLNCALVRKPVEKQKIVKDLRLLFVEILQIAKVEQQSFDIVNFAETLKEDIEKWRDNVKNQVTLILPISENQNEDELKQLERRKIESVETLQDDITEKYKYFMRKVSQASLKILGKQPCNFTLVGMGSMARKEITPYSDFENIILLEEGVQKDKGFYDKILEYFRWYAVVFQVILINLGETILPSVAVPSLNNYTSEEEDWFFDAYTKRGISFDGMMPHACKSPLGRQPTKSKPWDIELIKPVSIMLKYLTQEQNLKNGYHLADILTNTCFVDGNVDVYQLFEKAMENVLAEEKLHTKQQIKDVIKNDMQQHSTKLGISSTVDNNSYNVKQFAYRSTTIFITGIAKLHRIKPGSCFAIVRTMQSRNLISEEFSHKLQYAVALACEIRLKTYLEQGYQYDHIELTDEEIIEDISMILIQAVGKQSCYEYLEIACCLQYDAVSCFKLDSSYMFFHPITMCIAISSFLHLYDRIYAAKDYIKNWPVLQDQPETDDHINDDVCWSWSKRNSSVLNGDCVEYLVDGVEQPKYHFDTNAFVDVPLGRWYLEMQHFNEKLTEFYPSQTLSTQFDCAATNRKNIVSILSNFGKYFFEKGVYFEAQYCFKTVLKMLKSISDSCNQTECLFWIGMCLSRCKNYESAEKTFLNTLELYKSLSNRGNLVICFEGNCHKEIGFCEKELGFHDKASKSFEAALTLYYSFESTNYESKYFCMLNMGLCLYEVNKFQEALVSFEKLLKLYLDSIDINQTCLANCYYHLGCCLQNLNNYDKGAKAVRKAIQIYQEDMECIGRSDVYKAYANFRIGKCLIVINNHEKAFECFLTSLQFWEELSKSYPDDKELLIKIAHTHKMLGRCYFKYNFNEKAVKHYEKSIESFQILKRDNSVDKIICKLHRFIGKAHRELENYEEACTYFKKGLSMESEETPIKLLADLNRNYGLCLKRMEKVDEAHLFVNVALQIYLKLYETEKDSISLLRDIGSCYANLDDNVRAREFLHKCIVCFEEHNNLMLSLNDRAELAMVLQTIGLTWKSENNYEESLQYFHRSLEEVKKLPKSLEHEPLMAWLHNRIGEHWLFRLWETKAEKSFRKAITLSDSLSLTSKGSYMLAVSYKNLGRACFQLKSFNTARMNFELAEKILSTFPNRAKHAVVIAWLFKQIGECFKKQNWLNEALVNLQKALDIYEEMSEKQNYIKEIAYILNSMGKCHQTKQQHDKALKKFKKSLDIYADLDECKQNVALVLSSVGQCHEALCCFRRANSCYRVALRTFEKLKNSNTFQEKIDYLKNKLDLKQYGHPPGSKRC